MQTQETYNPYTNTQFSSIHYVLRNGCSSTSWSGTGGKCEEYVEVIGNHKTVTYRCARCHFEEYKKESCLGTTQYGIRCKNNSDIGSGGYCNTHYGQLDRYVMMDYSFYDKYEHKSSIENYEEEATARLVRKLEVTLARELLFNYNIRKDEIINVLRENTSNVYFIECDGYIKIGKSDFPEKRFETLSRIHDTTNRPKGLNITNAKLLGYFTGSLRVESSLHDRLSEHRVSGTEWFKANETVMGVVYGCLETKMSLKNILNTLENLEKILPSLPRSMTNKSVELYKEIESYYRRLEEDINNNVDVHWTTKNLESHRVKL